MNNIIIVDDCDEKIKVILSAFPDSIRNDIDIAISKASAQQFFSKKSYDLAIIDLALPRQDNGSPIPTEGVNLIQEINEFDWFKAPKRMLAITQHEELDREYSEILKELGVTLHYHDGTGSIEGIIKYQYDMIAKANSQVEFDYDAVIVAALDEEAKPILEDSRFTWNRVTLFGVEDITIRTSSIQCEKGNKKIALVTLPRMGLVSSSITTSRIVNALKPRCVVMPGICAGVEGEVNYGDIIIANPSWEWQTGKWKGDDFSIEPYQISVNQKVIGSLERLLESSLLQNLWQQTLLPRPTDKPNYHIGPMVSGSSVISNAKKMEELRGQHRKLKGLEMEIFGVYAACVQSHIKPNFIGFKSVCDFGTEEKGDSYHEYCAEICGKLCVEFVNSLVNED